MIKINDERRLLNLNHTVIYIVLSTEEHLAYGEKLHALNEHAALTRGLFRFEIVERGDSPYELLPDELVRAVRRCNVFVRLINSIHGIFCYGLEYVDVSAATDCLVRDLGAFVDATCNEDLMQLEILATRSSMPSVQAMAYYTTHRLLAPVFQRALRLDTTDLGAARLAIETATQSADAQHARPIFPPSEARRATPHFKKRGKSSKIGTF